MWRQLWDLTHDESVCTVRCCFNILKEYLSLTRYCCGIRHILHIENRPVTDYSNYCICKSPPCLLSISLASSCICLKFDAATFSELLCLAHVLCLLYLKQIQYYQSAVPLSKMSNVGLSFTSNLTKKKIQFQPNLTCLDFSSLDALKQHVFKNLEKSGSTLMGLPVSRLLYELEKKKKQRKDKNRPINLWPHGECDVKVGST